MQFKSQYLQSVYDTVCKRNPDEPEFLQAVREVLESFEPVVERRPDIVKTGVIDRIVEPERFIQFRVSWVDDNGKVFEISPDPMLAELQAIVAPLEVKEGEQDFSCLKNLYSRADIFGVNLYEVGLGEQIEGMVKELYAGNGAVRKTLHKYVVAR